MSGRAVDWDEYGWTWAFDTPDEARAWVAGLLAARRGVELVCRVHDVDYVPVPDRGEELCWDCEAEHRQAMRLTDLGEAWSFLPPGEKIPDGWAD